ncbi:hypothetical protein B0T19DRAFT_273219 [Cercophora scortea]|uniref:Uncharacterized protein n=1 Tax=Cercophora scortea TaxID=314031 RepID=A0AAE0I7Q5_9PEZI|nr:hypothetical protein B0T19DRAFT_273219 [Cercophora scortea]
MAKRAVDPTAVPSTTSTTCVASEKPQPQKKTERSHEENQERAYIAASRRADRSIEARVQSAKNASEIHKKRTGKGFKISEEIVLKEEMYEEEEEEFPRHFRSMAFMHTNSPEMNSRVSAYVSNHMALTSINHQNEVNRMFAEQFPGAAQVSQQLSQSVYSQPPPQNNLNNAAATSRQFSPPHGYPYMAYQPDRRQSMPQGSLSPQWPQSIVHGSTASPPSRHASVDVQGSPPALTPGSGSTESYSFPAPLYYQEDHHAASARSSLSMPVDPSMHMSGMPVSNSSFTSELPSETKFLTGFDMTDPMTQLLGGGGELIGSNNYYHAVHGNSDALNPLIGSDALPIKSESAEPDVNGIDSPGYFDTPQTSSQLLASQYHGGTIGTPGGGPGGDPWSVFLNLDDEPGHSETFS